MVYVSRQIQASIQQALANSKSILLLGARQTGKTTLIKQIPYDVSLNFMHPATRLRYAREPGLLTQEITAQIQLRQLPNKPLIVCDEVQKIPEIMDEVQTLIDDNVAQFVLTGSSSRKLKNLLPGRVLVYKLYPLNIPELPTINLTLETLLVDGSLPGILSLPVAEREAQLDSYVLTYLEEEIRAEATVRNIGHFARFLELACIESGNITNHTKISQDVGVSSHTINNYYNVLEDCLVATRIEPIYHSKTRKALTKSPKYLIFDLGIRRIGAREGRLLSQKSYGHLFEQFVGLELMRAATLQNAKIKFWRDPNGLEIDWIWEKDGRYLPIEVKWSDRPALKDAHHLRVFLQEYSDKANMGFIICRSPSPLKLSENIMAIPWQNLTAILNN